MIEFINLQKNECSFCGRITQVFIIKAKITKKTSSYITVHKGGQNQIYRLCLDCIERLTKTLYEHLAIPQQAIFDAKMKKAFKNLNISTRNPKPKKGESKSVKNTNKQRS